MVSKASEDLPLPERPVTTTMTSRGNATVMFFRLCSRAPWTTIWLSAIFCSPLLIEQFGQVYGPRSGGQSVYPVSITKFSRLLGNEFRIPFLQGRMRIYLGHVMAYSY